MKQDNGSGSWFGYVVVMILLFCYFAWILDRMAAFSKNGFPRLDAVVIGIAVTLVALGLAMAPDLLRRRRGSRHQ